MDRLWYLSQINMLETLPSEDFEEVDKMTQLVRIEKNKLLQTPDNAREGLFFIKEGKIRLFKINQEGKQFTVGILGKANVFGEIESFSVGTKDTYIETIEETMLCSMGKEQFETFLAKRPQLALKLLKLLNERLKERDAMLEKWALGSVRDRVIQLLLNLSQQFGVEINGYHKIDIPLTHQEIANMVGATREKVTLVLSELSKDQLIRTGRMSIYINAQQLGDLLAI